MRRPSTNDNSEKAVQIAFNPHSLFAGAAREQQKKGTEEITDLLQRFIESEFKSTSNDTNFDCNIIEFLEKRIDLERFILGSKYSDNPDFIPCITCTFNMEMMKELAKEVYERSKASTEEELKSCLKSMAETVRPE